MTKSVNQLINYFRPSGYFLSIDARPGEREFQGVVYIAGVKTGKFVRLHAKGLTLENVRVNKELAEVRYLENDEIELIPEKETELDRDYAKELAERWGEAVDTSIAIEFSGKITEGSMHGLYPCKYEFEGESRELLATQFESHHAREVFPCVDEPAAKAKFLCQINTDPKYTVLSNMPSEVDIVLEDDTKRHVTFQMTPKMSTYLLAFVIGDLKKISGKTKSGVDVNIFATPAQSASNLNFALGVAIRSIDFYDEYFGVPYPLPKSDHVALPDFSSGAMENWGLITYRETCLLVGDSTSLPAKQFTGTVIAHELAHQWFGNLTTMEWWNDLWLNESFASLMEHYAIDQIYPDWKIWQNFETQEVVSALRRDAISGVQSIQQDVEHPDEISTLFDSAIVYAKGERMLRMLQVLIGEDAFRAGLKSYFERYSYKNTVAADLWSELGSAASFNVSELMNNWLTKPGYPVITAKCTGDTIELEQKRFLTDGKTDETLWRIPLFSSDENAPRIMSDKKISFQSSSNDFQLNVGNFSHFITHYDDKLQSRLNDRLSNFTDSDRLKIINEAIMLGRSGLASSADLIDLLKVLKNEESNAVWDLMSLAIGDIRRIVEDDYIATNNLKRLAGQLAGKHFDRLGILPDSDDNDNDIKLRSTILSQMIFAEDTLDASGDSDRPLDERPVTKSVLDLFTEYKYKLNEISGDIRPTVLAVAVRVGDNETIDFLVNTYKSTSDAELQQDITAGLTSVRKSDQIDRMIDMFKLSDVIRAQDLAYWFSWMLSNRFARTKTWEWLKDNWPWIENTFGGDKSFDVFPRCAGQIFSNDQMLNEYKELFLPLRSEPALKRAIDVGINDIVSRIDWIKRDYVTVANKLNQ